MRSAEINRKTNETDIQIRVFLDAKGLADIDTGCGFFDHMLKLFTRHSHFDLSVRCNGDTDVDYHHTVEDIGISLGEAFKKALGDKRGIQRYASTILPMDEALILTAVDLSGRAFLNCELDLKAQKVGDFDTELVKEFFLAFTRSSECTLHIKMLSGENTHHIIEAVFKSFAKTMRDAVKIDEAFKDEIPSTKGVL